MKILLQVERNSLMQRLESAREVEAAVEAGLKRANILRQAVLKPAFERSL